MLLTQAAPSCYPHAGPRAHPRAGMPTHAVAYWPISKCKQAFPAPTSPCTPALPLESSNHPAVGGHHLQFQSCACDLNPPPATHDPYKAWTISGTSRVRIHTEHAALQIRPTDDLPGFRGAFSHPFSLGKGIAIDTCVWSAVENGAEKVLS